MTDFLTWRWRSSTRKEYDEMGAHLNQSLLLPHAHITLATVWYLKDTSKQYSKPHPFFHHTTPPPPLLVPHHYYFVFYFAILTLDTLPPPHPYTFFAHPGPFWMGYLFISRLPSLTFAQIKNKLNTDNNLSFRAMHNLTKGTHYHWCGSLPSDCTWGTKLYNINHFTKRYLLDTA